MIESNPILRARGQLVDLTLAVANINMWNRLNIAFRTVPGTYRAGMYKSWIGQGAQS